MILIIIDTLATNIEKIETQDKLWGFVSYDTIFTVLITLFVFISGILIDRFVKYRDKKTSEKELRYYFKHFLDKVIDKTCPKLIKNYKEVYQNHDINVGILHAPPKILTSDFTRIRNIQDKELFNAFLEKKSYSQILSYLDFVELIINEIDFYHKKIRKESDDLRRPLQEKLNEYMDILASYPDHVRENNPQYPNRDEFKDLVSDSIFMFHDEQGLKNQISNIYKKIIRPIQEKVVQTNIFRLDPIGFKIAELGKDISIQYNYIKRLTVVFRLEYRRFSRKVEKTQEKLIEERKKINWG